MNILFILQDALRPDHMGCYGYRKDTTPNIDRLAAEGVVFRSLVSVSSHTFPPIVSLITGQNIANHAQMTADDYTAWKHQGLWEGRTTPLHTLASNGFLVDGELVLRWSPLGFTRDTVEVEGYFEQNRCRHWFFFAEPYSTHLPYNPPDEYYEKFLDPGYRPSLHTLEHLHVVRSKMLVHPPGVVSAMEAGQQDTIGKADESHERSVGVVQLEPEDTPGIVALYDGEVRVFDDLVGRWVNKLADLGLLDETLIVITADHAEELMERGRVGHSSCNLHGTLYDESIIVPLILYGPRVLPRGRVVENQVSQIDVMPTLMALLGLPMPRESDGCSLIPLIRNETSDFRREAYAQTLPAGWQRLLRDDRQIWCVRRSDCKLILNTDFRFSHREYEFYDLLRDPKETTNIFGQADPRIPSLVKSLEEQIRIASAHRGANQQQAIMGKGINNG